MSEGILIVTKGMPRIRVSEIDESLDVIDPNRVYIKFVPWDTDNRGRIWGMFNLTPEFYEQNLAKHPNLREEFSTFEKMLEYFDKDPNFFFADPMNTGAKYSTLHQYRQRLEEIKETFTQMFEGKPAEKLKCRHEGCNMTVGLDEHGYCRHHRE